MEKLRGVIEKLRGFIEKLRGVMEGNVEFPESYGELWGVTLVVTEKFLYISDVLQLFVFPDEFNKSRS